MLTLHTSFKPPLLHYWRWLWIARRKTLQTFVQMTSKNSASGWDILIFPGSNLTVMRWADPGVPLLPQIMCSREFISSIGRTRKRERELLHCVRGIKQRNSALQTRSNLCIPRNETARHLPNFHINVSVSDLYIPMIGPTVLLHICLGQLLANGAVNDWSVD